MNTRIPIIQICVIKIFNNSTEIYTSEINSNKSDPTGTFHIGVMYDFRKDRHLYVGAYHPRVVVRDRLNREHPIVSQLLPDKHTIYYYIGLSPDNIERMRILYNIRDTLPELTEEVIKGVALATFQAVLSRHE